MKRRILYLDPISHTGLAYYSYSFVEALAAAGHEVTYGHSEGWLLESKGRRFETVCLYRGVAGDQALVLKGIGYIVSVLRTFAHACRGRYDSIHLGYLHIPWIDLALLAGLRLCGQRVVLTIHEVESIKRLGKGRSVRRWAAGFANSVIVQNEETRASMVRDGLDGEKVELMQPGGFEYFDDRTMSKEAARAHLELSVAGTYILCFGSISNRKDLPLLLSAFSLLPGGDGPEPPRLLIVGRPVFGYSLEQERAFVVNNGLSERVVLRPAFVPVKEAECWYKAADIVVLPYRSICESGVLRQAFTYGCPTIVSDLPQLSDVTVDGANCLLFEPGDEAQLSARMQELLDDPEKRARIGENAQSTMDSHGSWTERVRSIEHLYA